MGSSPAGLELDATILVFDELDFTFVFTDTGLTLSLACWLLNFLAPQNFLTDPTLCDANLFLGRPSGSLPDESSLRHIGEGVACFLSEILSIKEAERKV